MGRFESAAGGTLFLDEVGNLSLPMQAKLLRALETGEITPVGSNRARPVDARLVAATSRPLHEMVLRHEFRQDLLYRLNTIEISVPPLRERTDDIPLLVEHYCTHFCRVYRVRRKKIPTQTMQRLTEYPWPGNIRELKHAVERAVIVSDTDSLAPEDFLTGRHRVQSPDGSDLNSLEKSAIRASLSKHKGNVSRAAEELGLSRASLYRRLRKYGLAALQD